MANDYPDYYKVVQDVTGGYGAKVDESGYLAVFAVEGSGFANSRNVFVYGEGTIDEESTGVTGDWTNVDTTKDGKYVWLEISCDDMSTLMEVELWNETTNMEIIDFYFVQSAIIPLAGSVVEGTDTMYARFYNNAHVSRTFKIRVFFIEVP